MTICRFCRGIAGDLVLDLGRQPACDYFPSRRDPAADPVFPLQLWLCGTCGLAQLAQDPTMPEEARGIEPTALADQARDAVTRVAAAGLLVSGGVVMEHGSPHGGSWLPLLAARGVETGVEGSRADVVLDCFGLMHEADIRAALELRAAELAPDGVLFVQFHSLAALVTLGQWNAVRHGHPVYLSVPSMVGMLDAMGLTTFEAWTFDLYGGTVLLAARRGARPGPAVARLADDERAAGVTDPVALKVLQDAAATTSEALRNRLLDARAAGATVLGYGAASRAVPLLNHAGIGPDLLTAVADASPAKHGRRIPGVAIPVVSLAELVDARPDEVVLFVPDLLDEVRELLPQIEAGGGKWVVADPLPREVLPAGTASCRG